MLGRLRVVGAPMLKAEGISCSGPKLPDAQTRNFEAIKYTHRPSIAAGSTYLQLDQSSEASQQTAPTRRISAASDGKLWTTRARRLISRLARS